MEDQVLRYLLPLPIMLGMPILGTELIPFTLHQGLHLLSVLLALFLTSTAILAYLRHGRRKFLLLAGAFFIFTVNESVTMLATRELIIPVINDPLGHALNLAMLTLFAGGLFIKDGDSRK